MGLTNNLNDRLYMATPSGLVICLREIGQLQPRPLRDPKQPPFGYIPPEGALPSDCADDPDPASRLAAARARPAPDAAQPAPATP